MASLELAAAAAPASRIATTRFHLRAYGRDTLDENSPAAHRLGLCCQLPVVLALWIRRLDLNRLCSTDEATLVLLTSQCRHFRFPSDLRKREAIAISVRPEKQSRSIMTTGREPPPA
jgi:hypothetical protein